MDLVNTILTWILYISIFCGTYYTLVYSWWVGLCLTLPGLLGDFIVKRSHQRAAIAIKLLLFFQIIMLWTILPWATLPHFDTTQMSPHVVNIIQQTKDIVSNQQMLVTDKIKNWIPNLGSRHDYHSSSQRVQQVFGNLSATNFPDLKYRTREEVRKKHDRIFSELPEFGFDPSLRNPCWFHDELDAGSSKHPTHKDHRGRQHASRERSVGASSSPVENGKVLSCLPYVYLLGQPKCGTSDLFERLTSHPDIIAPDRKEIRWFTRGEFQQTPMNPNQLLGPHSSIFEFTSSFEDVSIELVRRRALNLPADAITIDGGPHTLWWPTQSPDGTLLPDEIPPPQIIRELQPNAKFLITLSDPVKRMYSDYYFLDDSLVPVESLERRHKHLKDSGLGSPSAGSHRKSPGEFHARVVIQLKDFDNCMKDVRRENPSIEWFRASQICGHDRFKFAKGGWGRLSIGLYVLFIEKWLEHFSLDQFHVVRLEDYKKDPIAYMSGILKFLDLQMPKDGTKMFREKVANEHKTTRPDMLPETEKLLRDFYAPYNEILARLLGQDDFLWGVRSSSSIERIGSPNTMKTPQPEISFRGSLNMKNEMFSLDGLDMPDAGAKQNEMTLFTLPLTASKHTLKSSEHGSTLCIAAFALDLLAIKKLLYDFGVPGNAVDTRDFDRNAFHCLGMMNLNVDGHSKSHIFRLLKGDRGYLTDILDPPLPLQLNTTIGPDIIKSLEPMTIRIAKWLLRAGCDVTLPDRNGVTPLHYAAVSGSEALVKFMLDNGASPNKRTNTDQRTPMHYAAAYGHAAVLKLMMERGGDLDIIDYASSTPRRIISASGAVLPHDAIDILNIKQNNPRNITRPLHPSYDKNSESIDNTTIGAGGGFDHTRLPGYETAMHCDADQYNSDEITGKEIYENYLALNRPVLIRGLIDAWPAVDEFKRETLLRKHGDLEVLVSSIPYATKFAGTGATTMSLSHYMEDVTNRSMSGGKHPWYVFIGHPLKSGKNPPPKLRGGGQLQTYNHHFEEADTTNIEPLGRTSSKAIRTHLVDYNNIPTPPMIHEAMQLLTQGPRAEIDQNKASARSEYVNAQWAYGGAGTGAPVHYHNTAWNALVYGAKYWVMYPPHALVMSNRQILQFIEEDLPHLEEHNMKPLTCVQTAGDVMIIPESWSHGVLNIQESVAVATEASTFHWRFKPGSRTVMNAIPKGREMLRPGEYNTVK